jgi:hypothetical protein
MAICVLRRPKMNGIMVLKNAPIEELLGRYKELYGDNAAGTHRLYLWRKIAYRLQEREQGTLSTKAKVRLKTLIEEYDPINNKALRPDKPSCLTVITKEYKDTKYQVKVLEKGFEYTGKIYKTLSAIAKEITGAHWNGYLFFNL